MDDMFWAGVFPNYRYRLDQMGERLGQIGVDNMRQELIEALQEEMKVRDFTAACLYPFHEP